MNTSLFSIVTSVIEDINQLNFNGEISKEDEKIKNLCDLLKLVFANENKQEVERELFSIAQQCRDGLNAHCGILAMELLELYMAS